MSTAVDNSVIEITRSAKAASRLLSTLPTAAKDEALELIASALESNATAILAANAADVTAAEPLVRSGELSQSLFQRLLLSEDKLRIMIEGVRWGNCPTPRAGYSSARFLQTDSHWRKLPYRWACWP